MAPLHPLEQALVEDPDNRAAYEVYADWLLAAGDPRGELVRTHLDLEHTPPGPEADMLTTRAAELEAACPGVSSSGSIDWRYGFIDQLFIGAGEDEDLAWLADLLEQPVGRLIRKIESNLPQPVTPLLELLAKVKPPLLRHLELGSWNPRHEPGEYECELGDMSEVWVHRRLEQLTVCGRVTGWGAIDAPSLVSFDLGAYHLTDGLTAMERAHWPKLETLALECLSTGAADVDWILAGKNLSQLKHLALRRGALPEEREHAVAAAPIVRQLETLDLNLCAWHQPDSRRRSEAVRPKDPRFAHLKTFVCK